MTVQEADKKRWGGYTTCPQYRLLKWKRRCEKYKNIKLLYGFLWMIYRKLQIKYGVDLPASTKIGPGFKIEHLNGIVVNEENGNRVCMVIGHGLSLLFFLLSSKCIGFKKIEQIIFIKICA